MKEYITRIAWIVAGGIFSLNEIIAQSPTHIDTRQQEPGPFTLKDNIFFIIIPALLLMIVIWYRYYQKNKQKEKE